MTRDLSWPLLASFLWITGGLGWSYYHELEDDVNLTPIGRGLIVVLSPLLALLAIGSRVVTWLRVVLIILGSGPDEDD